MSRKLSAVIAATLCFASAAQANMFTQSRWSCGTAPFTVNSFYLGAGVGSSSIDYHTMVTDPNTVIDLKLYGNGVLGNLQGGYQAVFDQFTLAIDAFVNGTSQRTNYFTLYGPDGGRRDMQFSNDWNAGVSILPGYMLNSYLIAYLRLGYINSHYKVNVSATSSYRFTNNISGGEIGLGGEVWFPMLKNVSVRGEYDTIIAPRWNNIGSFTSAAGGNNKANVDINNGMFQINFIYHLIYIREENMVTFTRNIGFILLAIFLILSGIMALIPGFAIPGIVFAILEIAAGIFILLGR